MTSYQSQDGEPSNYDHHGLPVTTTSICGGSNDHQCTGVGIDSRGMHAMLHVDHETFICFSVPGVYVALVMTHTVLN